MTRRRALPKVMFVINSLGGGGAERVLATILARSEAYRARAHIALALLDKEAIRHPVPDWVETHQLDCRHSLARSVAGMANLARVARPDLTLSFLTRANVASILAMAARRRPAAISERVNTSAHLATGRNAWASKLMVRLAYPWARRVVAVSEGVADTLASDFGVRRDRIIVVDNPVDVARIQSRALEPAPFEVRPDDLVAMGRLVPNKNFALAIEAFAMSAWAGRLIIIGEGPERTALQALGDRLGLGDRLVMPGFIGNPYPVLTRAHCVILSSNAEGFPNALVEALALGVPAIATDCPSGPAYVLDVHRRGKAGRFSEGSGGLLVPAGDAPAIVAAIDAMRDPATRARLSRRGTTRALDFSVAAAVDRYWDVIDRTLAADGLE